MWEQSEKEWVRCERTMPLQQHHLLGIKAVERAAHWLALGTLEDSSSNWRNVTVDTFERDKRGDEGAWVMVKMRGIIRCVVDKRVFAIAGGGRYFTSGEPLWTAEKLEVSIQDKDRKSVVTVFDASSRFPLVDLLSDEGWLERMAELGTDRQFEPLTFTSA